jgi:hypothetical protein
LEKRAEQVLPESEGVVGEREEVGAGGRNSPNNVCIYESMNKKKVGLSRALMAHACNPSYSVGRDQEDQGLKPASK